MELQAMRKLLIESAIKVVAHDGLEHTTTKSISTVSHLNEVYIYRCFDGKDDLLKKAYLIEDDNFAKMLYENMHIMKDESLPMKERAFLLWKKSWDFILEYEDDCKFYLRYYYSASHRSVSNSAHMESYRKIFESAEPYFKEGTPTVLLIHQIFDTMLCFAARVMSGEEENDDFLVHWAFEQILAFVVPHVRPELFAKKES